MTATSHSLVLCLASARLVWPRGVKAEADRSHTDTVKEDRALTLLDDVSAAAAESTSRSLPWRPMITTPRTAHSPLSQLPLVRFGPVESRLNPLTFIARVTWCPTVKYMSKTAARSLRSTAVNEDENIV
ncbi:hypothetical protein THAOC_01426 [Thalassiosira oceanica]|uniref:Secreted protein n=1 Tax=Thalassiosira oceanica TaxID=159749 RepID=K0TIF1_THAOC|nr:hypothetical protein THAOC_01426 [Thalassiosira oceanica]|eukprot:EJK76794.1 hypothetical protein THAOC_01426 [Thalassiosira oceanica]